MERIITPSVTSSKLRGGLPVDRVVLLLLSSMVLTVDRMEALRSCSPQFPLQPQLQLWVQAGLTLGPVRHTS